MLPAQERLLHAATLGQYAEVARLLAPPNQREDFINKSDAVRTLHGRCTAPLR